MTFYIDSRLIIVAAIWIALGLFGYFYNGTVARKMNEGYAEHVWLFVVIGVAVTLLGAALRDPDGALWVLTCFVFSGSYMVYGAINHNVTKKRISEIRARQAVLSVLEEMKHDAKV